MQDQLRAVLPSDLLGRPLSRPEVCHRGGHDQEVGARERTAQRLQHLGRRFHCQQTQAGVCWVVGRCHQGHLRAPIGSRLRHRESHLAAGVVAEESDGVDRLAGAAGAHHDAPAGQVVASSYGLRHGLHESRGTRQPPRAGMTAGEAAGLRLDHQET